MLTKASLGEEADLNMPNRALPAVIAALNVRCNDVRSN